MSSRKEVIRQQAAKGAYVKRISDEDGSHLFV